MFQFADDLATKERDEIDDVVAELLSHSDLNPTASKIIHRIGISLYF